MSEVVNTYQTWTAGFAATDDIVLDQTPQTRLIFRPLVHPGGVRGHLVRLKIGRDRTWCEVNEVNFNRLPPDCGVKIELDTRATSLLFGKLTQLYEIQKQGVEAGDQAYIVARQGEALVIDDGNKAAAIQALLDQGHSEEFWEALTENNPSLATKLAAAKIELDRREAIRECEAAIAAFADDEDHWQDYFERNPWILQNVFSAAVFYLSSECYIGGKGPITRQGAGGVATDFLFADESTKSFAVVEIKTPATPLIGRAYRGRRRTGYDNETYSMHSELSGGIVQVRNQIATAVDDFGAIGRHYAYLNRIHPKGVLVIGRADTLDQRQKDSFNHFRQGLFGLTVITYDELLHRLKLLFGDRPGTPEVEKDVLTGDFDPEEPPF